MGNVRSDVLKRLWKLFQERGVEIPFPQRDLHLRTAMPELVEALTALKRDAGNSGKTD